MGSEAGRLPENAGLGVAGVPPRPLPNRALSAEAWVVSSVEQEQLLMTFREKLMMRNASWHFGSASEQPRACTRGRGRAGAGVRGGPWRQEFVLLCRQRAWPHSVPVWTLDRHNETWVAGCWGVGEGGRQAPGVGPFRWHPEAVQASGGRPEGTRSRGLKSKHRLLPA